MLFLVASYSVDCCTFCACVQKSIRLRDFAYLCLCNAKFRTTSQSDSEINCEYWILCYIYLCQQNDSHRYCCMLHF